MEEQGADRYLSLMPLIQLMEMESRHLAELVDSGRSPQWMLRLVGEWVLDVKQDVSLALKYLLKSTY